jgi:uncharacterized protein YukE
MSDQILLEPAQAGQTLGNMQGLVKHYLDEILEIGQKIKEIGALTYSDPIEDALQQAANCLTEVGNAVNAGVDSYCEAFRDVVNLWKQSDAVAASQVSFARPSFAGVHYNPNKASKLDVIVGKIRELLNQMNEERNEMRDIFYQMDEEIEKSVSYWIGNSGDRTRQAWKTNVYPMNDDADKLLSRMHELVEEELAALVRRDHSIHVC